MTTPSAPLPAGVDGVLATLLDEPGRPRLTWYATDGERIELSGAVLVNWVNKTTNLLVEEFDAAPGLTVRLDLPPHWRTLVWALAVWRAGACVVLDADGPTDVHVTSRPQEPAAAQDVVAVALPGLARTYPGELPPGALDAAAAVMTYGDTLGLVPPTLPDAPALRASDASLTHGRLVAAAAAALTAAPGDGAARDRTARVMVPARPPLPGVLLRALGTWACGASLVLVEPPVLEDERRRDRLVADERVTARLA